MDPASAAGVADRMHDRQLAIAFGPPPPLNRKRGPRQKAAPFDNHLNHATDSRADQVVARAIAAAVRRAHALERRAALLRQVGCAEAAMRIEGISRSIRGVLR